MIEDLGKYYLYRHIRLDINKVFYVGIGTKKEGKKLSTYDRAFTKKGHNNFWNKIVNKTNYKVQILIESNNYKFIEQKEIEFISLYGRRNLGLGTLVNLTDGGEARRNVIVSEETRKKISKSSTGRLSPNKGKKWSQEFKNKISNSLKGNKLSKESIEKRTNTLKQKAIKRGFYQHEKWKQNIGKSNAKIVYAIINNNFYEFESCHKAEKILNISFQSISYACNKYPKSYKNMYFSYNKDKINQQINKQS